MTNKYWTKEEEKVLIDFFASNNIVDITDDILMKLPLKRTKGAIRAKINTLKHQNKIVTDRYRVPAKFKSQHHLWASQRNEKAG